MRSQTGKYFSLVAGLLVALSVICSQSFSTISEKSAVQSKVIAGGDQNSSDEEDGARKQLVTLSVTNLPTPTVIHFTHEAFCLFEIFFPEQTSPSAYEPVALPLTKFFSTLLSVIISPNAP